jgi:hypothetical protein
VSKDGPIVGPVPLRRVVRMLIDGRLGLETRIRAATSPNWITKPGLDHTIDTLNRLIVHSRAQRRAKLVDIYSDLGEFQLTQELNYLVVQQSEIALTEVRLKRLQHGGVKALKEDSRHHIKRTLRALCFCTQAEVVTVANNCERFKVQVHSDHSSVPEVYWYATRVLCNVGLPREAMVDMVLKAKGLPVQGKNDAADDMRGMLEAMEIPEIHQYCRRDGIAMPDIQKGIDINSATPEELTAAVRDRQVANAIYASAELIQIDSENDARLHVRGFKQHHAQALLRGGIRYPSLSFDRSKSFHPALKQIVDQDRIKNIGELTIEDRMFDRRVKFDPLSCFFGYATDRSSWWFLVELLRKMVVNLVYLRGVDSCDNFPWQELLIVCLIFYALLHSYEMPFHTKIGNFLEMFSTMFIVMVLHAATSSDPSGKSYLSSYIRALFVLLLITMMGMLLIGIKARTFLDNRRHKHDIKTADVAWKRLRGGVGLIQRQNARVKTAGAGKILGLLKQSWMSKKVASRAQHNEAKQLAAGLAPSDHEVPAHTDLALRAARAKAFLLGEWVVEMAGLPDHPSGAHPARRPGHTMLTIEHYRLTLETHAEGTQSQLFGVLSSVEEERDGGGPVASVSVTYSESSLVLQLQWTAAESDSEGAAHSAPHTAFRWRGLSLLQGALPGNDQGHDHTPTATSASALVHAVYGHRVQQLRVGDRVLLSDPDMYSKKWGSTKGGCLHGTALGEIVESSAHEDSLAGTGARKDVDAHGLAGTPQFRVRRTRTAAAAAPAAEREVEEEPGASALTSPSAAAAVAAEDASLAPAEESWYTGSDLIPADHVIEIVGDGTLSQLTSEGPQRHVHFFAHRLVSTDFFEPPAAVVPPRDSEPEREKEPVARTLPPLPPWEGDEEDATAMIVLREHVDGSNHDLTEETPQRPIQAETPQRPAQAETPQRPTQAETPQRPIQAPRRHSTMLKLSSSGHSRQAP